jgi:tetratricopeptide (TPR) repeat protein
MNSETTPKPRRPPVKIPKQWKGILGTVSGLIALVTALKKGGLDPTSALAYFGVVAGVVVTVIVIGALIRGPLAKFLAWFGCGLLVVLAILVVCCAAIDKPKSLPSLLRSFRLNAMEDSVPQAIADAGVAPALHDGLPKAQPSGWSNSPTFWLGRAVDVASSPQGFTNASSLALAWRSIAVAYADIHDSNGVDRAIVGIRDCVLRSETAALVLRTAIRPLAIRGCSVQLAGFPDILRGAFKGRGGTTTSSWLFVSEDVAVAVANKRFLDADGYVHQVEEKSRVSALIYAAGLLAAMGEKERAIAYFREAEALTSLKFENSAYVLKVIGVRLADAGLFQIATQVAQRLSDTNKAEGGALYCLIATALAYQGQQRDAVATGLSNVSKEPMKDSVYTALAKGAVCLNDLESAMGFREKISFDTQAAITDAVIGYGYYRSGQTNQGRNFLQKAVKEVVTLKSDYEMLRGETARQVALCCYACGQSSLGEPLLGFLDKPVGFLDGEAALDIFYAYGRYLGSLGTPSLALKAVEAVQGSECRVEVLCGIAGSVAAAKERQSSPLCERDRFPKPRML